MDGLFCLVSKSLLENLRGTVGRHPMGTQHAKFQGKSTVSLNAFIRVVIHF